MNFHSISGIMVSEKESDEGIYQHFYDVLEGKEGPDIFKKLFWTPPKNMHILSLNPSVHYEVLLTKRMLYTKQKKVYHFKLTKRTANDLVTNTTIPGFTGHCPAVIIVKYNLVLVHTQTIFD